jgi:hypothetical protein
MIVYQNTEKELTFSDYKPLPVSLRGIDLSGLHELRDNIENAINNAISYHSELLSIALQMDINKVNMYIRMQEHKTKKQHDGNS